MSNKRIEVFDDAGKCRFAIRTSRIQMLAEARNEETGDPVPGLVAIFIEGREAPLFARADFIETEKAVFNDPKEPNS